MRHRLRAWKAALPGRAALLEGTSIAPMLEAALWGFLAASSLVLGAVISFQVRIPERALGLILAFGAGVLMSTVAYELVADSLGDAPMAGLYGVSLGVGALTFYVGSVLLARRARRSGASGGSHLESHRGAHEQGNAIVLGTILDGVPESIVLGVSLLAGPISVPVLVAVFISNVPESLGASADLREGGASRGRILQLWLLVAAVSAAASGVGHALLSGAPDALVTMVELYAGGAILAMLAESMVPEAYQKGGRAVGLATVLGFAVAATLSATV